MTMNTRETPTPKSETEGRHLRQKMALMGPRKRDYENTRREVNI